MDCWTEDWMNECLGEHGCRLEWMDAWMDVMDEWWLG